jgi:hypothetical protein
MRLVYSHFFTFLKVYSYFFGSMEVHISLELYRCGLDILDLI